MRSIFRAPESAFRAAYDGTFRWRSASTRITPSVDGDEVDEEIEGHVRAMEKLQRRLYAGDRFGVLFVFQAMDAAGKDGTIRAVTRGLNPAACNVTAFKAPTHLELERDFMWRVAAEVPMRGHIGVWNRSHYEEVLAVRVHPELLEGARVPEPPKRERLWRERLRSIRDYERHWARNGFVVVKFWLHVSAEEQAKRLLARIDDPDANWKFRSKDVDERRHWRAYMDAYEAAVRETSRPWAPWYVIPADHKPTMRVHVARIMRETLESMELEYPVLSDRAKGELEECRRVLLGERN